MNIPEPHQIAAAFCWILILIIGGLMGAGLLLGVL